MATIQSTMAINDKMTRVLQTIIGNMNKMLEVTESISRQTQTAANPQLLNSIRQGADLASRELIELQQDLVDTENKANSAASGLEKMAGAAILIAAAKKAVDFSKDIMEFADTQTRNTARISIMLDTGQAEAQLKQDVANYQAAVDQAANRSRSDTTEFANITANFGINAGNAFKDMNQVVGFTEQLQKHFAIAGTSAQGAAGASLQLQQALSMGTLRGQELRSVMESAPTLIQAIADYMGKPRGEIKALAEEGLISSGVIVNAMAAATDDINSKFESMPMTFEQMGVLIKNSATESFRPIMESLTKIVNSQAFAGLMNSAKKFFSFVASAASFLIDHWDQISLVLKIAGVFLGVFTAMLIANKIALLASAVAAGIKAVAEASGAAATGAAMGAQLGLNAAMWACPVVWIIAAIIAIIGVIIALVAHFKKSESTIGAVFGSITMGIGFLGTFFKAIGLIIASAWRSLWNNAEIKWLEFLNIVDTGVAFLLEKLLGLINLLNKIPGISIDTSWVDGAIANTQAKLDNRNARIADLTAENEGFMNDPGARWDAVWDEWNTAGKEEWWAKGYNAGANLEDSIKGATAGFDPNDLLDAYGGGEGDPYSDQIAKNTAATAKNTANASEDVVWLRDIAEREAVNRVSISTIDVNMSGMQNSFGSEMDVDGFTSRFLDGLREAQNVGAEGVHA